jgi:hypothetical protein
MGADMKSFMPVCIDVAEAKIVTTGGANAAALQDVIAKDVFLLEGLY